MATRSTLGLTTRWGRALDPDRVLQEHPRPQLVRDSCVNLNGWWEHAFTGLDAGEPTSYDGPILVPFSPEAPLSGVRRQLMPDELLWYRRTFERPDAAVDGTRALLHFGAVDQSCTVWVNGHEVGRNHGGYLPFSCDVTGALQDGSNTLVLRVRDVSDNQGPSSGKQRLDRGGIWYTAQSGIWQTVWVEVVPEQHVQGLVLTPLLEEQAVEVTVHADAPGQAEVVVLSSGARVATATVPVGQPSAVHLPDVRPWTPEDPYLYDVEVRLGNDVVRSYVGMRSFGIGTDRAGVPRLLLNGRPYVQAGVLDQGYWPDGLLTPPSDEALVHDIETMKRLGFTMLRKHIKIEPLRWYYHCDRLGMLVWQDMVNGGEGTHRVAMSPPGRGRHRRLHVRDQRYRLFGRTDADGRREFRDELRRTVELLRSVTSLAVWVPFNEGWGQFDANDIATELRALDPTRSIDHASGWWDQGGGDLISLHVYKNAFVPPERGEGDERVLGLTEYGGYKLVVDGHTWGDEHFGYRSYDTPDELAEAFTRLHHDELAPAVGLGLSATVYTQLSDVEDELNGLLTYDREVLKVPEEVVRDALSGLRLHTQ
ncbi:MAG TPA: glycoside hydrolase family 2 TIM barrel-domain containing protein [Marmoricola sp.]|nr:glycoside hydrolase family 2 TIM barrel-domain containing protein [Marmoricola sp.]